MTSFCLNGDIMAVGHAARQKLNWFLVEIIVEYRTLETETETDHMVHTYFTSFSN